MLPRLLLLTQITLILACVGYWHSAWKHLPRDSERPMERLTAAALFGVPLLAILTTGTAHFHGWRLAALVAAQLALYLTFLASLLPAVQ